VFCRNLLIYFDQDTQVRTVGVLARALAPDGLLFVGAAETGLLLSLGYASAQIPMAAAFRRQRTPPSALAAAPEPWRAPALAPLPAPRPRRAAPVARSAAPAAAAAPATSPAAAPDTSLEQARRLADHGAFDRAAELCQNHLRTHGPSAEALYLTGLIHGATGLDARAEDAFRKALYLQPDHTESLMHLALLLDAKGDAAGARLMRQRASRHRGRSG